MKQLLPGLAKRALAFTLAVVLLLALVPVLPTPADATDSGNSTNSIEVSLSSRSNPDNVFTFADPIDLVLNIKRASGVAVALNAAITVTNASGSELLAARGLTLPASTNIVLSVKDLVDLPAITTAGAYKVNVTLTDSTGAIQHQSSADFSVVALKDNLTATVTSATSDSFIFKDAPADLKIKLTKPDGIAEKLTTTVTVKDTSGEDVYSKTFETTKTTDTITPDLSGLPYGTYEFTATITDDAGNSRGNLSATFSLIDPSVIIKVSNSNTDNSGHIYYSEDDVLLSASITNNASRGENVTVKVTGTLNGKPFVSSNSAGGTLSTLNGKAVVTIYSSVLGDAYGIFEDIDVEVYDDSGNLMGISDNKLSFSRVLSTAKPGDLPLLNINDHFTSGKGDAAKKITLAAKAGANMWRATIPWATIEKEKGKYDITVVKSVMDATKNNGMQALIILAYGNDTIYGTPNPNNQTWLKAYTDYCGYVARQLAAYYPDQVIGFEIWNEWNHSTMSKVPQPYRNGSDYAKVVIAASRAIRENVAAVNTNVSFKIIAGATAGDGYGETSSSAFIEAMLKAEGFFDAVDGVSFHTYSSEETTTSRDNPRRFEYISPAEHDFAARITNYKKMLSNAGAPKNLEVWITETGWTTNTEPEYSTGTTDGGKQHITYGATEEEAAAYMVQLYTWALADGTLDRIFWYDFMNDSYDENPDPNETDWNWRNNLTECNYGLIHSWTNTGDEPLAYSAKAGYVAICALSSKLAGAKDGKPINLGDGIYAYQFSKDGKYITVAWTDGSEKAVTANLKYSIVVTDMYGNATTYSDSSVVLNLSEAPIYIEYASGAISFG